MSNLRSILVVDDDSATRRLYKFLLLNSGYSVVEAVNGVDALKKMADYDVHLVITDMNMPEMDGLELIRLIRRDFKDMPVMLVTAFGNPSTEKQARNSGADLYLAKPFDFHEMERHIDELIRSKSYSEENIKTSSGIDPFLKQEFVYIKETMIKKGYWFISMNVVNSPVEGLVVFYGVLKSVLREDFVRLVDKRSVIFLLYGHKIDSTIDELLNLFYDQTRHLDPTPLLTFGIAASPQTSLEELIAAIAQDHLERHKSQTGENNFYPPILRLESERMVLQERYEQLCYRRSVLRSDLRNRLNAVEHTAQAAIDQLIAVVNHDLTNGLNGCKETLYEIEGAVEHVTPDIQQLLDAMLTGTTICRAFQHSLAELGTGWVARPLVRPLQSWLSAAVVMWLGFFGQKLRIELEELPEQSDVPFDDGLMQVVLLNTILAAQEAGASVLRLSLQADGPQVLLVATDDGMPEPRYTALTHLEGMGGDGGFVPLRLMRRAALAQEIVVRSTLAEQQLTIAFRFPGPPQQRTPILTLSALRCAVEQVEQEVQALQTQLEAVPSHRPLSEMQTLNLLSPYFHPLGQQLGTLVERSRSLERVVGGSAAQRVSALALYCYLLVRNLALALKGETLPAAPSHPNEEIRQVLALLEHKIDPERLTVRLDLAPDLPQVAIASIELKQVLMNLIKNAVEAMPAIGIMTIRTLSRQDSVIIQVQDTGRGIPSKYRRQIFQLNFSTKGQGNNSGVGLYAVASLVERAGGDLRVASVMRDASGKLLAWQRGFGLTEVLLPRLISRIVQSAKRFRGDNSAQPLILTEPGTVFQVVLPIAKDEHL